MTYWSEVQHHGTFVGCVLDLCALKFFLRTIIKNSIWLLATTVELIFSVQINWLSEKDLGSIHLPVSTVVAWPTNSTLLVNLYSDLKKTDYSISWFYKRVYYIFITLKLKGVIVHVYDGLFLNGFPCLLFSWSSDVTFNINNLWHLNSIELLGSFITVSFLVLLYRLSLF